MKDFNRLLDPEEPHGGVTKGEATIFSTLLEQRLAVTVCVMIAAALCILLALQNALGL